MESSYLRLVSGSRLANNLGLKMAEGYEYRSPASSTSGYAYIEVPVMELYNPTDETILEKGMRNQYLKVMPACTVNVKGFYRFEVHPNKDLYEYGMVQAPFYLEPEEGEYVPSFYIKLRKDLDIQDIEYAIRIYMRA